MPAATSGEAQLAAAFAGAFEPVPDSDLLPEPDDSDLLLDDSDLAAEVEDSDFSELELEDSELPFVAPALAPLVRLSVL